MESPLQYNGRRRVPQSCPPVPGGSARRGFADPSADRRPSADPDPQQRELELGPGRRQVGPLDVPALERPSRPRPRAALAVRRRSRSRRPPVSAITTTLSGRPEEPARDREQLLLATLPEVSAPTPRSEDERRVVRAGSRAPPRSPARGPCRRRPRTRALRRDDFHVERHRLAPCPNPTAALALPLSARFQSCGTESARQSTRLRGLR